MGKFNLKTYSDSIVSFLAGNMQNKSAAEIVQDAAGNLHPFRLHDEDPQQKQCIPAPRSRGRGYGSETPAGRRERAARRRRSQEPEGEGGETRSLPSGAFSPRPPRLGRGGGGAPGATPRFYLNGPMGSWRMGSLSA